ncbi:MAG: flagellar basal body rod protein FlgB [Myxococcota bacterium]
MPLIPDPTARAVERALAFRDRRQGAIASNIANANTPGYRAFDLLLRARMEGGAALAPRRTDPRHLSAGGSSNALGVEVERSREPTRLDGNNVELEGELMKLLENRTLYLAGMELMDRWKNLGAIARTTR